LQSSGNSTQTPDWRDVSHHNYQQAEENPLLCPAFQGSLIRLWDTRFNARAAKKGKLEFNSLILHRFTGTETPG